MADTKLAQDVWAIEQFLLSNPLRLSRDTTDRFWRVLAILSAETVRADDAEQKLTEVWNTLPVENPELIDYGYSVPASDLLNILKEKP